MSKPILVIDDDPALRRSLRLVLETAGYTCLEAGDGLEALGMLDAGLRIDVIISDYHMPIMNGLEVLQALSYRANGQHVRVILVSGDMTKEKAQVAREAGVFGLLAKPYHHDELLELVSRAVQR